MLSLLGPSVPICEFSFDGETYGEFYPILENLDWRRKKSILYMCETSRKQREGEDSKYTTQSVQELSPLRSVGQRQAPTQCQRCSHHNLSAFLMRGEFGGRNIRESALSKHEEPAIETDDVARVAEERNVFR